MKFLIVLSLFVSASAFAQYSESYTYKCWDTTQGERGYPTYVFTGIQNGTYILKLKYPREVYFERKDDCWVETTTLAQPSDYKKFKVCLGEGQHIDSLIPVEIDEEYFEGTVYCERSFKRVFENRGGGNGGYNGGSNGGISAGATGGVAN
jgi:hypothetical protein